MDHLSKVMAFLEGFAPNSDLSRCSICTNTYDVSRLLPCLHSFCETCLQDYINKTFGESNESNINQEDVTPTGIHCPLCRTFIEKQDEIVSKSWAKVFPTNFIFDTVIALKNEEEGPRQCNTCKRENESKIAVHWCRDCNDALCESCERQHRKFKSSSSHQVISIDEAKFSYSSFADTNITCEEHKEVYKYYCSDHLQICCMTCVVLQHRQCQHVITVEEAAEAKRKSEERNDLMADLAGLKERYQILTETQTQNEIDLNNKIGNTRNAVDKFFDDLNCRLTEAKLSILKEIDVEDYNLPRIKEERIKTNAKIAGLDNNSVFLNLASKHSAAAQYLYTMDKVTQQKVLLERFLQSCNDSTESIDLHFTPHDNLSEILTSSYSLGSISVFRSKPGEEANPDKQLATPSAQTTSTIELSMTQKNVMDQTTITDNISSNPSSRNYQVRYEQRDQRDKNTHTNMATLKPNLIKDIKTDDCITGAAILDDGLILISKNGKRSMFIIDREGKELSSLSLDYYTWGIRMISPTTGAVVVYNKGLQFFSINNNNIIRGDLLSVPVWFDFTFHKDRYYIGDDNKITVYNNSHCHVRDISVSGIVRSIEVRDDKTLCYTVMSGCKLNCITMDGKAVFTYSHDELQRTGGITVDHAGFIYVCGYSSKNIHQLSHDGKLQRIIFGNLHAGPRCISFNTRGDKAVIGCFFKVLLYDLK